MADYDSIAGLKIPVLSSDPPAPVEGELWYNTTVAKFRGYGLYQQNAAWATAGNVNTGRRACEGMGTANDGLAFCGYIGGFPRSLATESWNGSSWTSEQNYSGPLGQDVAHVGGTGASSASGVGGYFYPNFNAVNYHQQFNGSAWSSSTVLPSGRYGLGSCGVSQSDKMVTAGAFANGGYFPQVDSYTWNGSAWSTNPNFTPGTPGSMGAQSWGSSATNWFVNIAETPTNPTNTTIYEYNGTSWATNPATFPVGTGGRTNFGTASSAISTGGPAGPATTTNVWNGSAWSTSPATSNHNHVQAMRSNSTSTPSASGWVFAGGPGNGVSQGETWTGPVSAVQNVDLDFS